MAFQNENKELSNVKIIRGGYIVFVSNKTLSHRIKLTEFQVNRLEFG